jgi:hypothetical protein
MPKKYSFPPDLSKLKEDALRIISPIKPANDDSPAPKDFFIKVQKTDVGRELPPYYLVYFLFVGLLGFENYGRSEKIAWSIPISFNNNVFLIEHRKMGLGLFAYNAKEAETDAKTIVKLISKAVLKTKPYFQWKASIAIEGSDLNVENHSAVLFKRYIFFLEQYKEIINKLEKVNISKELPIDELWRLNEQKEWLALATIDAFFSWTEHIFIHLAILKGKIYTGKQVEKLSLAGWQTKFKTALKLTDEIRPLYDCLCLIKEHIRNYVTHGAFGKRGEACYFHSPIGAIPVFISNKNKKFRFSFVQTAEFEDAQAIFVIENFISILWSGSRKSAYLYIQKSTLPTILTLARDGTYKNAMACPKKMEAL